MGVLETLPRMCRAPALRCAGLQGVEQMMAVAGRAEDVAAAVPAIVPALKLALNTCSAPLVGHAAQLLTK